MRKYNTVTSFLNKFSQKEDSITTNIANSWKEPLISNAVAETEMQNMD